MSRQLSRRSNAEIGPKASSLLQNALAYGLPLGDQLGTVALLHTWALARRITAAPDGTDRSDLIAWATRIAYMVGALSALRDRLSIGMQVLSDFAEKTDQAVAVATDVLGSSAFSAAFERGARINPEFSEIRQLAQGVFDTAEKSQTTPRRSDETSPWTNLSKAERQVAILAAAGLSNTLVAARRGTSVRTVDAQLAAILQKLMISSRHDIMDFIPEDRIAEVREEAARWIHSNRKQTPGRPPS